MDSGCGASPSVVCWLPRLISVIFLFYSDDNRELGWITDFSACVLLPAVYSVLYQCPDLWTYLKIPWNCCLFSNFRPVSCWYLTSNMSSMDFPHDWVWTLLLPVGRGRSDGGGCLDPDREDRLHQPPSLQDLRRLRLHSCPGWSHRHGNRRARLLCHIQGAQEAAACGKSSRHARVRDNGGWEGAFTVPVNADMLTSFFKEGNQRVNS